MTVQDTNLAARRAHILKALAHPSRIHMIAMLVTGELSVGEITGLIGADVSTISKHLTILKNAGLVTDRKEGNRVNYSLADVSVATILGHIDAITLPYEGPKAKAPIRNPKEGKP